MIRRILKNFKSWILLVLIIAAILRFYQMDRVPVSLYWDEVSQGYNAYSILETGKDEFGKFLPLLFRAFDDYKMPLNIYLTSLSVKAMGLNEFAVRFPSAFLGTLTVLVTYFLVSLLLKKSGWAIGQRYSEKIALISSFFLAISPWHIQFSRAGFEANITLFFIILGVYLFLLGLNRYRYYFLSLFSFVLACYGYRSVEIFLPILLIVLFIVWGKELIRYGILRIILGLLFFLLLVIPLLYPLLHEGSSRANQTSIALQVNENALNNYKKGINVNRKLIYVQTFIQNYLSQFNPQFLFISGDPNGRHGPRGMGLLYVWEIPFLLIGLYVLLRRFSFSAKTTIMVWLLAAPIPAALSIPVPHALRSLNILPMPQLLTAIGVISVFLMLGKCLKRIYAVALFLLVMVFFIEFISLYKVTNTKDVVSDWADGYKQLTQYVLSKEGSYDKVIVSGHYWEPYIYFLFYSKYDPKIYQKNGSSYGFNKYVFGGTSWDKDKNSQELGEVDLRTFAKSSGKLLVALSPEEYNQQKNNISFLTEIRDHNDKVIFRVGEIERIMLLK